MERGFTCMQIVDMIKHISWELDLFGGFILEPMCENNSLYLDGEELFCLNLSKLWNEAALKFLSSWLSTRRVMFVVRELAIQIHNEARKFAQGSMIKSVVAYGGTSVFYQASQLQRGCNILVATPGRLYLCYTLFSAILVRSILLWSYPWLDIVSCRSELNVM